MKNIPINPDPADSAARDASIRAYEQRLIENKGPLPVDLRAIPRAEWKRFIADPVALCPEVRAYLKDRLDLPMTQREVHMLEDMMTAYHGVTPDYYIGMDGQMQDKGHGWMFIEAAAPYRSGFFLGFDEASK